jgi:hypothetical protein
MNMLKDLWNQRLLTGGKTASDVADWRLLCFCTLKDKQGQGLHGWKIQAFGIIQSSFVIGRSRSRVLFQLQERSCEEGEQQEPGFMVYHILRTE